MMRRRRFLQASGVAAGSLFLPSLLSKRAHAQGAPARRLVIMYTQHGTVYDNWRMRPAGEPDDVDFVTELDALAPGDMSTILGPLHAHRQKIQVLDGLALASATGDELINEHTLGTIHSLTGKMLASGSAGAASIDQLIANEIAVEGRVNSLELAVVSAGNGGAVFRGPGQSLPADSDVGGTYARLFPPPVDEGGETMADRVRRRQPGLLDFVAAEHERLAPRLSRQDKQKLELHAELLRDVEARVRALQNLVCERPAQPSLEGSFGDPAFYDSRFAAMAQMTTAALACDLTRVATIQMGQLTNAHCGAGPGDIHADFAHQEDVEPGHTVMTEYSRVHATQFAQLLAMLDSVPEGSGTLLDNTLVVWCGELATGTHKFNRWPVVIGGGGNMGMNTGRYVRWAPTVPTPSLHPTFQGVDPIIGQPHNRMWLSVAQKMGVSLDAVGESELFTTEGVRIECATPLDRV